MLELFSQKGMASRIIARCTLIGHALLNERARSLSGPLSVARSAGPLSEQRQQLIDKQPGQPSPGLRRPSHAVRLSVAHTTCVIDAAGPPQHLLQRVHVVSEHSSHRQPDMLAGTAGCRRPSQNACIIALGHAQTQPATDRATAWLRIAPNTCAECISLTIATMHDKSKQWQARTAGIELRCCWLRPRCSAAGCFPCGLTGATRPLLELGRPATQTGLRVARQRQLR